MSSDRNIGLDQKPILFATGPEIAYSLPMTRKHFTEIARAINEQREEILNGYADPYFKAEAMETLRSTAIRMAAVCGGFNDNFDYQKFLTACGF